MKSIDEIERISLDELEVIAGNTEVPVPDNLVSKLETVILASALSDMGKSPKSMTAPVRYAFAAAFAAVVALALMLSRPRNPEDTFCDPEKAYAQLEETFALVSSKMGRGLELASEAAPGFEITSEAINKINNR